VSISCKGVYTLPLLLYISEARHWMSEIQSEPTTSYLESLKEGGSAPKAISDYCTPSITHIMIGPRVDVGEAMFRIKPSLISMVQANKFEGKWHEDANAHLQQFLEVCGTIVIKGITTYAIRVCLFAFTLLGIAKQWFYAQPKNVNTWTRCVSAFLRKFFPMGKTSALRTRISSFQ